MFKIVAILFGGLFLWEHFGRINHVDLRPTLLIGNCTEPTQKFFIHVGNSIAHISSYLYHMGLEEIIYTLSDLIKTMLVFVLSPVWSAKGFLESVYYYYGNSTLIYIGAALLFITFFGTIVYFQDRLPLKRSIDFKSVIHDSDTAANVLFAFVVIVIPIFVYYKFCVAPTLIFMD
jgi:hypothetical protein